MTPVRNWLMQFENRHLASANRLLTALRNFSSSFVRERLHDLINDVREHSPLPVACYAIRKVKKGGYFPGRKRRPIPVANEGEKQGTGSEALVSNWITNWSRADRRILDHPTLSRLSKDKIKTIILVDDIIGSGAKADNFLCAVGQSKTIRSWLSYKTLEIHVVAFCAAPATVRRLEKSHKKTYQGQLHFHYLIPPDYGRQAWSETELRDVQDACRRQAQKTRNDWMRLHALGYGNLMGTVIFEHSCPNNSTSLLWHPCDNWAPLFPEKSVPQATLNGQYAEAQQQDTMSPNQRALAVIAKGIRRPHVIAEAAGVDVPTLMRVVSDLMNADLVNAEWRVTPEGRREAQALRKIKGSLDWTPPASDDSFYFPRALRRSRANG